MGNIFLCCCCGAHDPDSASKKPLLPSPVLNLAAADDRGPKQVVVRPFVPEDGALGLSDKSLAGNDAGVVCDGAVTRADPTHFTDDDGQPQDARGHSVGSRYSHLRPPTLEDIDELPGDV